jgi:hypothetical protein
MSEKHVWLLVRCIILVIVGFFTAFAFSNQPCDIDAVYLSCRVNGSLGDIIGFGLFYATAAYLAGLGKLVGFDPSVKGSGVNIAAFVAGLLGLILIWNL